VGTILLETPTRGDEGKISVYAFALAAVQRNCNEITQRG